MRNLRLHCKRFANGILTCRVPCDDMLALALVDMIGEFNLLVALADGFSASAHSLATHKPVSLHM
jgi:hypothetical protein